MADLSGYSRGLLGTHRARARFDSPFFAITSPFGQFRLEIGGLDVSEWAQKNSIRIERTVRQRAQCSFQMQMLLHEVPGTWPRKVPPPYSTLEVFWQTNSGREHKVFGGIVYESPMSIEPGNWVTIDVRAPSLAARLDHRVIEGYEQTTAGETVAQTLVRLMTAYADGEGISTSGVHGTDTTDPDVYDYITVTEMIDRLADQSNSVWDVTPDGVLRFVPRGALSVEPYTLTLNNVESLTVDSDLQRHRTRQTVIGARQDEGQERQLFDGDGTTRVFILDHRVQQVIDIQVGGVAQLFGPDSDGHPWIVDVDSSSVTVRDGHAAPPAGTDNVSVLYDFRGPVLATRTDSSAAGTYGIIHNVLQDSALGTQEEVDSALDRQLEQHNTPNTTMRIRVLFDAVSDVRVGTIAPIHMPEIGIVNERWLVTSVTMMSFGDGLVYDMSLVDGDYEEQYQDYYRRVNRLTTPTGG